MFKNIICIIAFLVCGMCESVETNQLPSILITNIKNKVDKESGLPRNFRATSDSYKREFEGAAPSRKGLKELNIAGSAQFSVKQLDYILRSIKPSGRVYIVDLREEWHGFFNEGVPVSWYGVRNASNQNKSTAQITREEKELFQDLLKQKDIILSKIVSKDKLGKDLPIVTSMPFRVESVFTEEELAAKYQLNYIRIPVTDALNPNKERVDLYLTFIKNLPQNVWLYFHCAAGVGRTTSFMVMYDIIKNAKEVSFEDILQRQYLIGGTNLTKYAAQTSWKHEFAVKRHQFLKDFYAYARTNTDNYKTSWSEYVKKNNLNY